MVLLSARVLFAVLGPVRFKFKEEIIHFPLSEIRNLFEAFSKESLRFPGRQSRSLFN